MQMQVKEVCVVIKGREIFKPFSATLHSHEMVAITGASGCGKTTLLNALGLIHPIERGQIFIDHQEASRWSDKQKTAFWKEQATFIYQDYGIIEEESVAYNLTLNHSTAKDEQVQTILAKVGMSERAFEQAVVLSGGEKQRIGIARALYKKAKIIYADEPTASLDAHNRQIVIRLLKECAANGALVLLATHDERLVNECHKVIQLDKPNT